MRNLLLLFLSLIQGYRFEQRNIWVDTVVPMFLFPLPVVVFFQLFTHEPNFSQHFRLLVETASKEATLAPESI